MVIGCFNINTIINKYNIPIVYGIRYVLYNFLLFLKLAGHIFQMGLVVFICIFKKLVTVLEILCSVTNTDDVRIHVAATHINRAMHIYDTKQDKT